MKIEVINVDIPIKSDNVNLKASIYYSKNVAQKAPWIINCPGLPEDRNSFFVKFYSEKFVNAGYYVLSYDYRGMGETSKQTGKNWLKFLPKTFSDIHEVISWILENRSNQVLDNKIVLFGRSLGGAIILTHGFIDERAKKLIPLCARYDYSTFNVKFPKEAIKDISPKYFLKKDPLNNERVLTAHCKDDQQIPFENILHIKEHLGLNDENTLIYETGGHSFKEHREELFEKSIEFLKKL